MFHLCVFLFQIDTTPLARCRSNEDSESVLEV